ncbi:hypothetical protein LOTGIDRAFT_173375 [Lottia gigantea]|uniref:IQ domain-containing protein C n=1 Tax=Lottia gigantea TaxID=225164 RepID=V4CE34_LOTGI|nr:hypothetical protein LOTGIDRAFT_173375 [Lottia gigantea]ESP00215.1 hypothetical protein LOTGIDRAFT_173375 [Lottia gigantea]
MAEENDEYFQLLEEIDINQLMLLQAYIRGTLTRRWLTDLRLEYQKICQEIERKDLNVEWPSEQPCLPKISSKRHRKSQKSSEKSKDIKFSVEIQTDFENFSEPKDNPLNSVSARGTGTVSDPVVINDSVLDVCNQTDREQDRLDSLDSIPVRDSDSQSQAVPREHLSIEETSDKEENSLVPNYGETNAKEIHKTDASNSVLCDVTSVWDAELSSFATEEIRLPTEKSELKELRKNLAMELLWIQQAIQSRKNYLRLKNQMGS